MLDTPPAKLQKRNVGEATEVLEAVGMTFPSVAGEDWRTRLWLSAAKRTCGEGRGRLLMTDPRLIMAALKYAFTIAGRTLRRAAHFLILATLRKVMAAVADAVGWSTLREPYPSGP